MSALLRGTGALARAYLLRSFRSRTSLFWNFAFPLVWLFVFGFIFGGEGEEGAGFLMPGIFAITILAISFAGVSYRLVNERENGTLRRYRVTPVRAPAVVLANAAASLVLLATSLLLLAVTAWLVFGVPAAGGAAAVVLVMAAGSLAFVPLGLVVGSVAPSTGSAPAINNAVFFPLIFVTGAAIPFSMLPGWVQAVGEALPPTYLVEGLQAVMVRGEPLAAVGGELAVLGTTAVVGAVASSVLFRWESGDRIGLRRALGVAAGLVLFCLAVAWLAPEPGMAEQAFPGALEMLSGGGS